MSQPERRDTHVSQTQRRFFPLQTAHEELRLFRAGKIIGPLAEIAMSLQIEGQNILQLSGEYDPETTAHPHYPIEEDDLVAASPVRDGRGKVVDWVEWRDQSSETAGSTN